MYYPPSLCDESCLPSVVGRARKSRGKVVETLYSLEIFPSSTCYLYWQPIKSRKWRWHERTSATPCCKTRHDSRI